MQSLKKNRKLEILTHVKSVLSSNLDAKNTKVFIFGSQANQNQWKNSDVDIGIDAGEKLDNKTISKIKYILNNDLPTLFTFDLVDFCSVSENFRKIALRNIEPIEL